LPGAAGLKSPVSSAAWPVCSAFAPPERAASSIPPNEAGATVASISGWSKVGLEQLDGSAGRVEVELVEQQHVGPHALDDLGHRADLLQLLGASRSRQHQERHERRELSHGTLLWLDKVSRACRACVTGRCKAG